MGKVLVLVLVVLTVTQCSSAIPNLRFFWHGLSVGKNATVVDVAKSPSTDTSPTRFGTVRVMDDPLTVGLNDSSQVIGRAQGMYLVADQEVSGLLMVMTFVFYEPEFEGSTLAVVGRNEMLLPVREMPIVGGSGVFRYATGYVQASTRFEDSSVGKFVVEYNCFISFKGPELLN